MKIRILLGLLFALNGFAAPPAATPPPAPSVLVSGGSMMNGDHFADSTLEVMRRHYAGCKKVALVLHASLPAERDRMEARLQKAFAHIGVPAAKSLHRHDVAGAKALLESADGIFIGGGETFVLLGELYRTGQLELIRQRVAAGVPYGGSSAGANVAGLRIGTTNDFPVAEIPSRTSLGVFPAVINPHHPVPAKKAEHDGRAGKIKIYLQFNPTETVVALADASIARLHDGKVTLECGQAWLYRADGVRTLAVGELVPELAK
jgi:dipeptidase E